MKKDFWILKLATGLFDFRKICIYLEGAEKEIPITSFYSKCSKKREEEGKVSFPLCTREKLIIFLFKFVFTLTERERAPHYRQVEVKFRFPTWPLLTSERESFSLPLNGVGVLAPHLVSTDTMVRVATSTLGDGESSNSPLVPSDNLSKGSKRGPHYFRWKWKYRLPSVASTSTS